MAIKKTPEGPMQTAIVRLPPNTLAALKAAAVINGRGERGMGEEIRHRLEASFDLEKSAVENRYLGTAITNVAESVAEYFGSWSQNRFAFEVLQSAIGTLLETMRPQNYDPTPKFNPKSIADVLFDKKDGPEKIGRSLAGIALATTPNIKPVR